MAFYLYHYLLIHDEHEVNFPLLKKVGKFFLLHIYFYRMTYDFLITYMYLLSKEFLFFRKVNLLKVYNHPSNQLVYEIYRDSLIFFSIFHLIIIVPHFVYLYFRFFN